MTFILSSSNRKKCKADLTHKLKTPSEQDGVFGLKIF